MGERGIKEAQAKINKRWEEKNRDKIKAAIQAKRDAYNAKKNAEWKAEKEAYEKRVREEAERVALEKAEIERLRLEEEEAERRRRAPWTCEECEGSGKCSGCG